MKAFSKYSMSIFFVVAGTMHFVSLDAYVKIMPPYLPWHLELVYISGVAEIALGALMLLRRWQAVAGWGMIALCVAVFPANLHMALHPELFTQFSPQGLLFRLPLQAVAIAWAWCYTREWSRVA